MARIGVCALVLLGGCLTALTPPERSDDAGTIEPARDAGVDGDAAPPAQDAGSDAGHDAATSDVDAGQDSGSEPRTFWTPCDRTETVNCSGGTCYSSQCAAPDVVPDARCSFEDGADLGVCTFDCFAEYAEVVDGHLVMGVRLNARLKQACHELGGECVAESAEAHAFCVAAN